MIHDPQTRPQVPLGADSLAGKDAWITGAGRGIGRACAVALGSLGARVHLVSRTASELEETAGLVQADGGEAVEHVVDLTDLDQTTRMFADQRVDVLVASAGTNVPQVLADVTPESYAAIMDINVRGALFTTQSAVTRMRSTGSTGSIILVSSQMGHVGGPKRTVYCASKWAVEGMARALAVELAPEGIRVNTVAPTFVETGMTTGLDQPEFRRWVLDRIPMARMGTPEDVASAVAFLASPASGLTTGSSLMVDGGWTAQ